VAIDATELISNVSARLLAQVTTLAASLPGTPTVYLAELERPPNADTKRIGVQVSTPDEWLAVGKLDASALLICDLFWPRFAINEDPWQIDKAMSKLAYGLRNLSITFLDYATYASPATVSGARLRVWKDPTQTVITPENDILRRQVHATLRWFASTDT
jgi:hypothetical protein